MNFRSLDLSACWKTDTLHYCKIGPWLHLDARTVCIKLSSSELCLLQVNLAAWCHGIETSLAVKKGGKNGNGDVWFGMANRCKWSAKHTRNHCVNCACECNWCSVPQPLDSWVFASCSNSLMTCSAFQSWKLESMGPKAWSWHVMAKCNGTMDRCLIWCDILAYTVCMQRYVCINELCTTILLKKMYLLCSIKVITIRIMCNNILFESSWHSIHSHRLKVKKESLPLPDFHEFDAGVWRSWATTGLGHPLPSGHS